MEAFTGANEQPDKLAAVSCDGLAQREESQLHIFVDETLNASRPSEQLARHR